MMKCGNQGDGIKQNRKSMRCLLQRSLEDIIEELCCEMVIKMVREKDRYWKTQYCRKT